MENRMLKRILAMLGLVLFLAVLVLLPVALYADSLYRSIFAGEQSGETAVYIPALHLQAEETEHQMYSRVNAWQGTIAAQEVSIKTARGALSASQYAPLGDAADAPWAIIFHGGLGTDRTQLLDVACMFSLRGYRVLLPDLFAHGKSEGEASALGYGDAQDVKAWVDYAYSEQNEAKIVLFGFDEGAAAVLAAAGEGLSRCVVAVAADSVFNDASMRLCSIAGIKENGVQAWLLERVFERKAGVKPGLLSEMLSGVSVPLLLIHGTGDQLTPAWNSEDIAKAAKNAELLFIEGAGNGQARFLDEELYYDTLFAFYDDALK